METHDFEKLGAFYLGKLYNPGKKELLDQILLYDSKDLTTHAVCVGMTGSGKTGLCVSILEEAAIDGIPSIIIDPKGDLGNLMLTFPELKPEDFQPWVDPDAAARKGLSVSDFARQTAELWKNGLAEWGQNGERISRFQKSAEVTIYTPGSQSGIPLSILRSFNAPAESLIQDGDSMRDRVQSAVSGLLTLLGMDADPLKSRDHILLSNIFHHNWSQGINLNISQIIREIQNPPFQKVGVFDLDSFYPAKDRFSLAMALNNLLASPGFEVWREGDPLDIQRLLYTNEGKPRMSILSIAHLSDQERMFFVTLLLNEVVAWVRTQPGTSSLRALLYMDEIFGYFPPTAVPPSKPPMLTLLKQARAYGLGVVLATQNPVDLDYKGLSNTGTWFIGRLQTERDKDRVLNGLEGASSTTGAVFERQDMEKILTGLGKRVFLMHNVHEDSPVLFNTRWVLSYLSGPMTRTQIKTLMDPRRKTNGEKAAAPSAALSQKTESGTKKPLLPPEVKQFFIPLKNEPVKGERIVYRPNLYCSSRLHYIDSSMDVDIWKDAAYIIDIPSTEMDSGWDQAIIFENRTPELGKKEHSSAGFAELPAPALRKENYSLWKRRFADYLYRNKSVVIWKHPPLKAFSDVGESEGDFRVRLVQLVRENRDLEVEKLRGRYAPRLAALQEKIRKAEVRLDKEKSQFSHQTLQTAISVGATVLGALFGRKLSSGRNIGRATTSMRGVGRAAREKMDVQRAKEEIRIGQQKLSQLEEKFQLEMSGLQIPVAAENLEIEKQTVKPRKSDISVSDMVLVWVPWRLDAVGMAEPAY
ncbi:MAG: ATP-binding protein [Candidatus Aminicenantes bacterium]|nr:ATP-binding protein [Candidatus Aminicenantes bacterium]